jgi:hypothetical protein
LLLGFTSRNKILNLVEPNLANKLQILADVDGHGEMIKQLQEVRLAKLDAIREEAITM